MSEQRFGFTVQQKPIYGRERGPGGALQRLGMGWAVYLPHQCDAWAVAGDEGSGVPHVEAAAELERFIAEAQVALAVLRREQEIDGEASDG